MRNTPIDDALLRQYLLGELAPEEQRRLEERLLFDRQLVERLLLAEEDLLDGYVSEELSPHERERFESYFLAAPERRRKLRLARALRRYIAHNPTESPMAKPEPAPTLGERLLAWLKSGAPKPVWQVAGSVLVLILAVAIWRLLTPSAMSEGMAALNAAYPQRPFESRLTGLAHTRWNSTRGGAKVLGDQDALDRATQLFSVEALNHPGPAADHALGRLSLMKGEFETAIRWFEKALKAQPKNAQLLSDLGAAYLELGRSERVSPDASQSLEDLAKSREHLEDALRLDGNLLDALFNLGLWRQHQRLWSQAEESWQHYLEKDSSSPWAEEARSYLKTAIEEQKKRTSQTKEQMLQDFLAAWQSRDEERAWQVVSRNREAITGKLVWRQLAEAFLSASTKGQPDLAENLLQAFAYAGELEREKAGDPFTAELADFYHRSSTSQRMQLRRAHELMNRGHTLFVKASYPDAIGDYTQAKGAFEQAGDHWEAALAEFFIGYSYFQTGPLEKSRALFTRLAETGEREKHWWLLVQVYNALGSVCFAQADYSASNKFTSRALIHAERIADSYDIQKNLAQLANHYKYLDDFDQSLASLHRCLQAAGEWWPGARQMGRNYTTLAQVFNSRRFYAAAADYQQESLRLALSVPKEFQEPAVVYYCYANLGVIYGKLHRQTEALSFAQRGYDIAQGLEPSPAQTWMLAYASLHLGHLYQHFGETDKSLEYYDQAVKQCQEVKDQVSVYGVYEARKGRLLCYLSRGEDAQAQAELSVVLGLAEKYRAGIEEEKHKNTFFDAEQSVYDLAIDFEHTRRGNERAAFDYSERSRARSLLSLIDSDSTANEQTNGPALITDTSPYNLEEIQARMPEQAQILQYAALEDKLLIWVITKTKFAVVEQKVTLRALEDKVLSYWQRISRPVRDAESEASLRREGAELYELLIAPLESQKLLERAQTICVVPDKALNHLPFNALISPASGQYLAQQYRLLFAPSATIFLRCSESARERGGPMKETLLSVGNPSFDRDEFPLPSLPDAEREAEEIKRYYTASSASSLLVGQDATEARVRSKMRQAQVIHLASHYEVDERFPRLSKLLLAKETGEAASPASDGVLRAEEIDQRLLPQARLVVLAACRSGVERYYRGEGMIGMSRTFLAARVPLVVASLWPVDSAATARLMTSFHRYRKQQGYSTSEALQRAQLEMIQDTQTNQRQPYYWAAFVAIGGHTSY